MVRNFYLVALCGLVVGDLVAANGHIKGRDEELDQHYRDINCSNDCFFDSCPSCSSSIVSMCKEASYMEAFICCLSENCRPQVVSDGIEDMGTCAKNFGVKFNTAACDGSVGPVATPSVTLATTSSLSSQSSTITSSTSTAPTQSTAEASTTSSQPPPQETPSTSDESLPAPTDSSASQNKIMLNGAAIIMAVCSIMLL